MFFGIIFLLKKKKKTSDHKETLLPNHTLVHQLLDHFYWIWKEVEGLLSHSVCLIHHWRQYYIVETLIDTKKFFFIYSTKFFWTILILIYKHVKFVCTRSMLSVAVGGRCCNICVESCSLFLASAFGYRSIVEEAFAEEAAERWFAAKQSREVPKKEYAAKEEERERKNSMLPFSLLDTHTKKQLLESNNIYCNESQIVIFAVKFHICPF